MPINGVSRRQFMGSTLSTATALAAAGPALGALGANERIRIGVIGTGGRGVSHITDLKERKDLEVVAICDVDDAQLDRAAKACAAMGSQPKRYKDFRQVTDLEGLDAVFVTACCHWHAIPAIRAMRSGKDVYVEKPLGHTIHECRLIAETAKQTKRIVQVGTQQRSSPHWMNAVARIRAGELGQVTAAHLWNAWSLKEMGGALGKPDDGEAPKGVDYDMWLGPAPAHRFNPARFHFGFYFFFDYSSGMTVAWGVHLFDVAVWALEPTLKSVSSTGGIYVLKDARDTPDSIQAVFDCGNCVMDYSLSHTNNWPRFGDMDHGIEFVGTKGVLQINRRGFQMFHEDARVSRKPYYTEQVDGNDTVRHHANFFDCMRSRKQPNADAEAGYRGAVPGYLANISYRVGRSVRWDAGSGTIPGDPEAAALLTKEYRKPWGL